MARNKNEAESHAFHTYIQINCSVTDCKINEVREREVPCYLLPGEQFCLEFCPNHI